MRTPRFYHPDSLTTDMQVQLASDALHHCANVLRLKAGASIVLFNGNGKEYACELVDVQKRQVTVLVETELGIDPQSPLVVHLAQGVSKGDRMEWVLQKATELGVTEITPIITERCNVKIDESRWLKKHLQWQKVLQGACEQSGRNTLPTLHEPVQLSAFTSQSTLQHRIILSPTAEKGIDALPAHHTHGFRLVIGPEGGLTDNEVHLLKESGYQDLSFGPRILRTETAAISAISVLQNRFGDLI